MLASLSQISDGNEGIVSELYQLGLAIALLLLSISFRVAVDKKVARKDLATTAFGFPVDIGFLVLSLLAAIGMSANSEQVFAESMFFFAISIPCLIFVVVLSNRSVGYFDNNQLGKACLISTPGYLITVFAFILTANKLIAMGVSSVA